jgi:competence protein ComEC
LVVAGRACGEGFLAGLRLLAGVCGRWAWIGGLDLGAALAWTILLGLVLLLCGRVRRPVEFARALPWVAFAALPAALAALAHAERERPMARAAGEVSFLDVGQGDAALLRLDQRHWLYDLGIGSLGGRRDRLVPALLERGVTRIERVWITHGDSDHWGGLADLLAAPIRIDTLVIPEGAPFPGAFWEALAGGPKRPVVERVASGWSRRFRSRIRASVLHPPPAGTLRGDIPRGANSWSVVLLLEGPPAEDGTSMRLLLSGDLERGREPAMLSSWRDGPAATVATLAHHGSRGAGSEAWWRQARPLLAVISVGAGNPYRLPHPATLAAAAEHNARLRRTDENGAIRCAFGPGWIRVRSARPPCPSGDPVL